jgi:hypothetical protein
MKRRDGSTMRQMLDAPHGSVYVWLNGQLDYPKALAITLARSDLQIVSPAWLENGKWIGTRVSGIVLDHAFVMNERQYRAWQHALTRVEAR